MILGALLQGIEVTGRAYSGSWWDWLTPYTLLTGLGVVAGYTLLGACWLIWKLEGEVQAKAYRLALFAALAMGPSGFVAVIAGWVTTEVGRQPWVVYGLLHTADARSPIAAPAVATSLLVFVLVYFAVFGAGTWYILRLMAKPPHPQQDGAEHAPIRSAGVTPGPAQVEGEP